MLMPTNSKREPQEPSRQRPIPTSRRVTAASALLARGRLDQPRPVADEQSEEPIGGFATEAATPQGFETEEEALQEDRLRARRIRRVLNRPGPTNWLNFKDRLWLAKQRSPGASSPALDQGALSALAEKLESGAASGFAEATLASSLRMRATRQGLGRALLDAFAPFPDADLCTVTVIYAGWRYSPAELDKVTAAKLKAQFVRHLNRVGVTKVPGPLFAVLHGGFEPTSGLYQLHFHLVTTWRKAATLKAGLTTTKIWGYTATATGASPVRRSRVRNRVRQFTYLAKGFWPSKPVIQIDGESKRLRDYRRIPEPFGAQVLLWLDRQSFADLVVTNDCWSLRKGGPAAMKRLCLFVQGR
jgi:hypothetical protein